MDVLVLVGPAKACEDDTSSVVQQRLTYLLLHLGQRCAIVRNTTPQSINSG
jgi:hypothetical protein